MTTIPHTIRRRRRATAGISTAEVLVGTFLTLMVVGAVGSFQRAQARATIAQNAYAESQTVTRSVMDLMTRELRMAGYDPTSPGALTKAPGPSCKDTKQGLVEASASKIRFKQDLNADGLTNSSGEDVTYDVLGDSVRRTDGANSPVNLVSGVPSGGFTLQYYDGSNPPIELVPSGTPPALTGAQRDCVAKIRITIRADIDNPTLKAPLASLAQSEVAVRNRSLQNF